MNLTEIRRTLAAEKIQLTKSLGQNFLHDGHQLDKIVRAGEISRSDKILEIGPGLGALTQLLVRASRQVVCLEKDKRLVDYLSSRFANEPGLTLIHVDALRYLQDKPQDWADWKVISNLPYSVGSPILVELARTPRAPALAVVTLQWEVARRIGAKAGESDYGILTLLIQVRYQVRETFKIPPSCFFPVPDVDSACLTLVRRPSPLVQPAQMRAYEKLVKRGFSQRRKMMFKLLKADWPVPQIQEAFARVGIPEQIRAEAVTLNQFVELTQYLAPLTPPS